MSGKDEGYDVVFAIAAKPQQITSVLGLVAPDEYKETHWLDDELQAAVRYFQGCAHSIRESQTEPFSSPGAAEVLPFLYAVGEYLVLGSYHKATSAPSGNAISKFLNSLKKGTYGVCALYGEVGTSPSPITCYSGICKSASAKKDSKFSLLDEERNLTLDDLKRGVDRSYESDVSAIDDISKIAELFALRQWEICTELSWQSTRELIERNNPAGVTWFPSWNKNQCGADHTAFPCRNDVMGIASGLVNASGEFPCIIRMEYVSNNDSILSLSCSSRLHMSCEINRRGGFGDIRVKDAEGEVVGSMVLSDWKYSLPWLFPYLIVAVDSIECIYPSSWGGYRAKYALRLELAPFDFVELVNRIRNRDDELAEICTPSPISKREAN